MSTANRAPSHELSWKEIGLLCEGLAFGPRLLKLATCAVTSEYSLGPRGAWILVLISKGIVYPLEVSKFFRVGRSLVTSELARLAQAGLISHKTSAQDRRRIELALTPLGQEALRRIRDDLSTAIADRLSGYSRDQILLLTNMLQDIKGTDSEDIRSRIQSSPNRSHSDPEAKSDR